MTGLELAGAVGAIVFAIVIFFCLRIAARWGEEAKNREEEYFKNLVVTTPDEAGDTVTIIRDPSDPTTSIPESYDSNQQGA